MLALPLLEKSTAIFAVRGRYSPRSYTSHISCSLRLFAIVSDEPTNTHLHVLSPL